MEAEYFGKDDQWDLTKPSFENITFKEYKNSMESSNGAIAKMLGDNPDKTYIGFFFISGHGLIEAGDTRLLLNEVDHGYFRLVEV